MEFLDVQVIDSDDGLYTATYSVPSPCQVEIQVLLEQPDGSEPQPIRGSPFTATFVERPKARVNEFAGPGVTGHIARTLGALEKFCAKEEAALQTRLPAAQSSTGARPEDTKALLEVRSHIKAVRASRESRSLELETVDALVRFLQRQGASVEANARALSKLSEKCKALE